MGVVQDGKFYVDSNHNGIFDLVWTHDASGQLYVNYGNGWARSGNPFAGNTPF